MYLIFMHTTPNSFAQKNNTTPYTLIVTTDYLNKKCFTRVFHNLRCLYSTAILAQFDA